MKFWRILVASLFLLFQVATFWPQHEYGHCLLGWAAGLGLGHDCHVRFVDHSGLEAPPMYDATIVPGDAPSPWWEHPAIYGAQAVWGALSVWLAVAFASGRVSQ